VNGEEEEKRSGAFSFSRKKRQAPPIIRQPTDGEEFDQSQLEWASLHLLTPPPTLSIFSSLFYYATDERDGRGFQCGSTIINDRFAVFAAHCLANFGT